MTEASRTRQRIRLHGPKLVRLRLANASKTQAQLAQMAGISERTLRDAEKGLPVSIATLQTLAGVYEVAPRALIRTDLLNMRMVIDESFPGPGEADSLRALHAKIDRVMHVLGDVLKDIEAELTDIAPGSVRLFILTTPEGCTRLRAAFACGQLAARLRDEADVTLIAAPEAATPDRQQLAEHDAHGPVLDLLRQQGAAWLATLGKRLALPFPKDITGALARYLEGFTPFADGRIAESVPDTSGPTGARLRNFGQHLDQNLDQNLTPIFATIRALHTSLQRLATEYDPDTLAELAQHGLLADILHAWALEEGRRQGMRDARARAFADELATLVGTDAARLDTLVRR